MYSNKECCKHHDYAFHGIGENFLIMESILTNGLVSESQSHNVPSYFSNTNSIAKINSGDGISVAYEFNSGAYNSYIKNGGISFLIEDVYGIVNKPGSFPGESVVKGSISPDRIVGLIVNPKLLNKKIEDFTFIQPHEATGQWIGKANFLKSLIEARLQSEIKDANFDELLESLNSVQSNPALGIIERSNVEKEILSQINKSLGRYASKMFTAEKGIENPTMLDVINAYNTKNFPILDVNLQLLYGSKNPIDDLSKVATKSLTKPKSSAQNFEF